MFWSVLPVCLPQIETQTPPRCTENATETSTEDALFEHCILPATADRTENLHRIHSGALVPSHFLFCLSIYLKDPTIFTAD